MIKTTRWQLTQELLSGTAALPARLMPALGRSALAGAVVLALFSTMAIPWLLRIPAFEKPDEIHHLAYARLVAREGRLPVQGQEQGPFEALELQQAPLYYLLSAAMLASADRAGLPKTDLSPWLELENPEFMGKGGGDASFFLEPSIDVAGQTRLLDLLLLRGFGLLLGLYSLHLTMRVGRRIGGDRVGLVAAAIMACLPQFGFIVTSVTNDALAIPVAALCTLYLIEALEAWSDSGRIPQTVSQTDAHIKLGLALGLALLTKATLYPLVALSLILGFGASLAQVSTRRSYGAVSDGRTGSTLAPIQDAGKPLGIVVGTATLLGGWWFVRNTWLYADPLGRVGRIQPGLVIWDLADRSVFDPFFRSMDFWGNLLRSSVGQFGMMNLLAPTMLYRAWIMVCALALAGLVLRLGQRHRPDQSLPSPRFAGLCSEEGARILLLGSIALVSFAGIAFYNLSATQPQGRLMFAALPAMASLLALGIDTLANAASSRKTRSSTLLLLLIAWLAFANTHARQHTSAQYARSHDGGSWFSIGDKLR